MYFCRLFQGATGNLLQQLSSFLGQMPPCFEVRWYREGNSEFGATHCLGLSFFLDDWEAWKDAPMFRRVDGREVVEGVGAAVKDLWLAFANSEH